MVTPADLLTFLHAAEPRSPRVRRRRRRLGGALSPRDGGPAERARGIPVRDVSREPDRMLRDRSGGRARTRASRALPGGAHVPHGRDPRRVHDVLVVRLGDARPPERQGRAPGRPLRGRLGRAGSRRNGARPGDREGRRMKDVTTAKLLRIHIGEADRLRGRPLFEVLVMEARDAGLAGATVLRGVESYGASSVVHRARLVELAEGLPIVGEIVDAEEKVRGFLERIDPLLTEAGCGVLMTLEKVEIVRYAARAKV